jgi:hypothetical protein
MIHFQRTLPSTGKQMKEKLLTQVMLIILHNGVGLKSDSTHVNSKVTLLTAADAY